MLSESQVVSLYEAHGSLAALSWAVVFPIGAIMVRVAPSKKAWIIHGGIMLLGLMLLTSAVGIGINRAYTLTPSLMHAEMPDGIHFITGLLLFSIAWTQPFLGYAHHYFYKITGQRSIMSTIHVFVGRVLMLIGIINGGIGILAADYASSAERIAYGVVVSACWLAYIFTSLWYEADRNGKAIPATSAGAQKNVLTTRAVSQDDVEDKGELE